MDVKADNGTISMEISVTRKETGKVERYILTGDMVTERVPVVHESSGDLVSQNAGVSL
jgi:hypothetical protein